MTATHVTVTGLIARLENVQYATQFIHGQFFSSPALFNNSHTKKTAVGLLEKK
jgi:hypothetical protein